MSMNIWCKFIKGDKLAFNSLMQVYFNVLFCYGCKFSKDQELVKDTIQELFIRIWETRENLSIDVKPKPYLMASLRRALHRKIKKEPYKISYSDLWDNINFFDFEISVEQNYIKNEKQMLIAQEMAMKVSLLPKRQKEVVYLKFFMDMGRDDICKVMDIRPQTVSNLLQSALKNLRGQLESTALNL